MFPQSPSIADVIALCRQHLEFLKARPEVAGQLPFPLAVLESDLRDIMTEFALLADDKRALERVERRMQDKILELRRRRGASPNRLGR